MQEDDIGHDDLPVIVQGAWSADKLHFVRYFSTLFSSGMKKLWPNRAYVDLFAGPGRCVDRETKAEFDGSPLVALKCETPFTHLFFNDINPRFVDALTKRQERGHPEANVQYFNSDCNVAARQIAEQIPPSTLTLVFIDPWNYELTFDGLAHLARRQATDLIVTFHVTAMKRAAHLEIEAVDAFLGGRDWRDRYWESQGDVSKPPTTVLIETFRDRLGSRLGYTQFGEPELIKNSRGAPNFYLLFASRHPRGLDFWEKASARLPSGQRTMF